MEPLKSLVHINGPRDPGPGERKHMLDRAAQVFASAGVEPSDTVRIHVPGRGQSEAGDATIRPEVEPVVPALQSGSLFGGRTGVLVQDAHHLRASEAAAVTDLLAQADADSRQVVFVSSGRLPAPLGAFVKKNGQSVSIRKLRERDALDWIRRAARERRVRLRADAAAALVERFGSDIEALGQALDQLVVSGGPVTADLVRDRFRNRPEEPVWHFTDALATGRVDEALRRLHDLLTHIHPLFLLGAIENDLRRRALASAAPDIETLAKWIGSKPDAYPTIKNWRAGRSMSVDNLGRALDAVRRTDATLKTMPEETHMVTMERLTVSLCLWYGR